ncbi:major capsid protein, partial [Streptomyces sp. DT225]
MTWVHTEADDISGATKPCFTIPCPDPVEVRCDAVGVCLEAGILTQRHFPELVAWYLRNAMVAHEIRIRSVLYQQALDTA